MKKFHKVIVTFLFFSLFSGAWIMNRSVLAAEIRYDEVPNSNKIITLNVNNKKLSQTLKKLALKARFNLIISPEFQDGLVSVNLQRVRVGEALKNLMTVGNFTLSKENNNLIVAKTVIEEDLLTEVIHLNHAQAGQIVYALDKVVERKEKDVLSYDEISNSIILKGNKDYVNSIKRAVLKLDLPKKASTFKLENYTATQMTQLLEKEIFNNKSAHLTKETGDPSYLEPVFDKELGYVIKGMVYKQESLSLNSDKPIIIPEEKNNEITIIANSHQLGLARELIFYLENKNIDKDEEIRLAHRKIYETRQQLESTIEDLKQTQLLLSDATISQIDKEIEIKNAHMQINKLQDEINKLKSQKLWDIVTGPSPKIVSAESNKSIDIKIEALEQEIAKNQTLLKTVNELKAEMKQKIALKDKQLEQAYSELNLVRAQLAEIKLEKGFKESLEGLSVPSVALEKAQKELAITKTELNRVRQQLDASKDQLELIYGGKFLDNIEIPETKSNWFR
jgi:hypothetical protein